MLLGFQSEVQREWLLKYGSRGVCADSTHGTNAAGYLLTTLVVIDDVGKGLPCAFYLSNGDSYEAIFPFFEALQERVGPISASYFMSDDAPQFYKAWCDSFGANGCKKLLCAWHIHKNWRAQIRQKVDGIEGQITVYHALCMLLQDPSEVEFRKQLASLLTDLEAEPIFSSYFQDNYLNRPEEWAAWARKGKKCKQQAG